MYKTYKKNRRFVAGFTVIELTLSLGIMAVIFILTAGIYTNIITTRIKGKNYSALNDNAQYIMQDITKNIKNNLINYDLYEGNISSTTSTLILKTSDSTTSTIEHIAYRRCTIDSQTYFLQKCSQASVCDLSESCNLENNFTTISSADVKVDRLDFHIMPSINPYTANQHSPSQPKVAIVLALSSVQNKLATSTIILENLASQKWVDR